MFKKILKGIAKSRVAFDKISSASKTWIRIFFRDFQLFFIYYTKIKTIHYI